MSNRAIARNDAVSDITTALSKIEQQHSRQQPYRAHLLRHHQPQCDHVLKLSIGYMTAHGMALMDSAGEPGTAFGFNLTSLFAVGLYLSKPLLPPTHLDPIVRETDLTARVTFGLCSMGFDCL